MGFLSSLDAKLVSSNGHPVLKDKSGVDEIIVQKQPYQLLNANREFFPSFDASNFHMKNLLINLLKLGQISSPFFCLFTSV